MFDLENATRIILDGAIAKGFFDFRLTVCGKGIEGVIETPYDDVDVIIMPNRAPRHLFPVIRDDITVTFRNHGVRCAFTFDETFSNLTALFNECFDAFMNAISGQDSDLTLEKE